MEQFDTLSSAVKRNYLEPMNLGGLWEIKLALPVIQLLLEEKQLSS